MIAAFIAKMVIFSYLRVVFYQIFTNIMASGQYAVCFCENFTDAWYLGKRTFVFCNQSNQYVYLYLLLYLIVLFSDAAYLGLCPRTVAWESN